MSVKGTRDDREPSQFKILSLAYMYSVYTGTVSVKALNTRTDCYFELLVHIGK